ncbi:unnamed protein product [Durusdinium trenchii]|uniref:Sugar phosphate transporter domain-containing protein n=1 Tax=Durusdinium trenchii TaxID=1381693 RepID=A0ABP0S486_9DINO
MEMWANSGLWPKSSAGHPYRKCKRMLLLLLLFQAVAAFHDHSEVSPKQTLVVNHAGQLLPQATAMPRPPASAMPAGHEALGRLVRPKDALSEESERSQLRRLSFMALGGAMLLGYLGFVAKSNDSTKSEDQSLLSAWPEAVPWMLLSMTLSIFNKWIFLPAGGNFPFPMTVSCSHMLSTSMVLHLLRLWKPQLFPGLRGLNWRAALPVVLLVGSLLAISVVLSNSAAVLLSVAFVNMLKGGNPVVALLLGLTLGTSSCNWRMLCPVLVIMFGAVATVRGELSLSYLGLALLVTAIVVEQFRLVLFKSMMSESGLSLDPLSALSLFAPVAFAFTAVAAACERQTPMAIDRVQGCALALNALVAVTLNIAYSRLLPLSSAKGWSTCSPLHAFVMYQPRKVASPVTFTVFGTAKDVTTAGLSLDMVGGTITPLQLCGYATTLFGMVYYDRVKQLQ